MGGATWGSGAEVFINKGTNGRWKEPLTDEDSRYESKAIDELGADCAQWFKKGERG